MSRNKIIALDFLAGVPATEIAARESISLPRVYQIVEAVKKKYKAPKGCSKEELGLLIFRYITRYCDDYGDHANTPEALYWELHNSRRGNE